MDLSVGDRKHEVNGPSGSEYLVAGMAGDKATAILNVVVGFVCTALGAFGFFLMAYAAERNGGLLKLLKDPAFAFFGVVVTLFSVIGVKGLVAGLRPRSPEAARARDDLAPASAIAQPWLARPQWRKREIIHGRTVGGVVTTLAFLMVGGPILLMLWVALRRSGGMPGEDIVALIPLVAVVAVLLGILVYWWLRHRRYGDSVCRLITLPGVIGDWFKADVECALPPDAGEPVIVRLTNLVPAGRRLSEKWRMEERLAIPVVAGARSVVPVRLHVPRHPSQVPLALRPGFWSGDGALWFLEIEKKAAGVDFFARFQVPIYDLPDAPHAEHGTASGAPHRLGAPRKNSTRYPVLGFGAAATIEMLAAVVVQLRLPPFLQGETVRFGRGSPIPTDQFVAWAVPILLALAAFSVFCARRAVVLRRKRMN